MSAIKQTFTEGSTTYHIAKTPIIFPLLTKNTNYTISNVEANITNLGTTLDNTLVYNALQNKTTSSCLLQFVITNTGIENNKAFTGYVEFDLTFN